MDSFMCEVYIISRFYGKLFRGVETYAGELSKRLDAPILNSPFPVFFKKTGSVIISTGGRLESIFLRVLTWIKGQKLIIPGQSGLGFDDKLNLLCFPDIFIALTDAQAKWAKDFNPWVRIEVIPNGVDLKKFTPVKIKPKLPTIGYVAALYPNKRQELLINAVAQTSARLLLIGDGPDKHKLIHLGQQLLPNRFEIKSVPHSQIAKEYQHMTLFTYPTVPWESFGIAMLEAMACNLPVIANDDPIRREIVGKAGLFATESNLVDQIKLGLKTNWGKLPRQQAEKFSWDMIANKYINLINNL